MHPSPGSGSASPTGGAGSIVKASFGRTGGREVDLYTLTNATGMVVRLMTYGAAVTSLEVPDRHGRPADVVLGFDDLAGYLTGNAYFGVTVGRVANRIRAARFTLERQVYELAGNDHGHHLHGGARGWDKVVWDADVVASPDGPTLRLRHRSPDGDEGYPGAVQAEVVYQLSAASNQLRITMRATTDRTTLVNLAHHGYFNLGGSGTILDHQLLLHAAQYTPGDPMIPTGEVTPVKGGPFDFTTPKAVGRDLEAAGGHPIGFDHNFVVDGEPGTLRPVARLMEPKSGRVMTVEADQPGVQLYTGNFLDGTLVGKGGRPYPQYGGLCLETQRFPNAINVPAWHEQVILHPGETYAHHMLLGFTTE